MAALLSATRHGAIFRPTVPNVWLLSWLVSYQRKSTNISAVDSFISELMENKKLKWKVLNSRHRNGKTKSASQIADYELATNGHIPTNTILSSSFRLSELYNELTNNPLVVNISQMKVSQVDHLLGTALNEQNAEDVKLLLAQVLEYEKLPSLPVLNAALKYLSHQTQMETIEQLAALYSQLHPDQKRTAIGRFEHYKALCQWKLGNTLKSLEAFRAIMADCNEEQLLTVDHILLEMIDETIGRKSEAVLLAVIHLSEYCLIELHHDFPICYVWEKSFLSAWHSDQEAAKTLFDRHGALREAVSHRTINLCYKLLYDNNVEKVYQLIELFLKHDMKAECKSMLIRLFEYQYWRKNLRGCSEIMQNAIDLNISLPEMCNRHLLELLLGRTTTGLEQREASKQSKNLKPNKYELKF
uniref:Pentacotripeptide-repeat region of PRORP domain-containing protein n=1 Tax=Anopheles funestus TaxID=62324 RepID=A0A182RX14_ANOFN